MLEPLLDKVSILFCSRLDGIKVLGMEGDGPTVNRNIQEKYGLDHVVSTDSIAGVYYSGIQGHEVFPVESVPVVDRPGAGDAFVAGTLHGYLADDVGGHQLRFAHLKAGADMGISPMSPQLSWKFHLNGHPLAVPQRFKEESHGNTTFAVGHDCNAAD